MVYVINTTIVCILLFALPAVSQTFFTERSDDLGALPVSRSICFGDYDNDGYIDAFIGENFRERRIALLHNDGNGRFVDRTSTIRSPIPPNLKGSGSVFGDYDNDGDLDLFVAIGADANNQRGVNMLLRNDRSGFVDVALAAGLLDSLPTDHALWLDYDRDGDLDLYTGNFVDQVYGEVISEDDPPIFNRLYRNEGDGTFSDQTEAAGLLTQFAGVFGGSWGGMAAGDFNNDGWPDLYLGVSLFPNRLFVNDGQSRFVETTTSEIADEGEATNVGIGDIDNDGDLDILQAAGGGDRPLFRSKMLLNLGDGQFLDVTEGVGMGVLGTSHGTRFADIDNDGDLDLVVGMRLASGETPTHVLMLNDGEGIFTDATDSSGIEGAGANVAIADYDGDGFVDLILSDFLSEQTRLYRNNGNANHWLRVELVGVESNRDGFGVRLFATAGDLVQMREVLGGLGRQQDEKVAHFGLGVRTQVDSLIVRWPSGQLDVLTDIPADQAIRVIEGRGSYHQVVPSAWETSDTLVVSERLDLAVRPALFEPGARITRVAADLSMLGGPADALFEAVSDGTYRLEGDVMIAGSNGSRDMRVAIEQETSLGAHWIEMSRSVVVAPDRDQSIYADALGMDWTIEVIGSRSLAFDLNAERQVLAGERALGLNRESIGTWRLQFNAETSIDPIGFAAVRFALHPGEAEWPANARLAVRVQGEGSGGVVDLLATERVVTARRRWQVVEVPLAEFTIGQTIGGIRLEGNLQGAFYLDEVVLVAARRGGTTANTAVREDYNETVPQAFALLQNYPNPFNSGTIIRYVLPEAQEVELAVYNLSGQKVATLLQGIRQAGNYAIHWDGRNDYERPLASGLYLCHLKVGQRRQTRKLVLLR